MVGSSGALQLPLGAQVANLSGAFFPKRTGTSFTVGPFDITLGVFRPGYDRRTFFYVHGRAPPFPLRAGNLRRQLPYDLSILPGSPRVPLPLALAALTLGLAVLAGLRRTPA